MFPYLIVLKNFNYASYLISYSINENVFQESDAATSFKEIRRRDP